MVVFVDLRGHGSSQCMKEPAGARSSIVPERNRTCRQRTLHDRLMIVRYGGPPRGVDQASVAQRILAGPHRRWPATPRRRDVNCPGAFRPAR
eukprot:6862142-Pyramimonas_sp.AAC.1